MAHPSGLLRLSLLVSLLLAGAALQAAGTELAGTYRVEQVTDLGSEVRVTLHIRLVNNTTQDLAVVEISLRDLHQSGERAAVPAVTRLQPREGTTVEHEFVVSRAEYERWSKGVRPALEVRLQSAGGREVRRAVYLTRVEAGRKP